MTREYCRWSEKVAHQLVLVLASLALTGCALTKDYVDLTYAPEGGVSHIKGAESIGVSVVVNDARAVKDKVSCKKNGYGMEMAPIISNGDVSSLVRDAIKTELRNRGFMVDSSGTAVVIELTKFYNDFKNGFWSGTADSEVDFTAQVKGPGGSISYSKTFSGTYSFGVQLASGDNARESLDEALKNAVKQLMTDQEFISALLKSGS
jgi:uncharacterized lipoprotein